MTSISTQERYFGNYRVLRLLGRGGQALVYLGEHRYLNRLAAIKVLRAALDERKEQQFKIEARILASLSHPHIVRVLEFGIEQGTPFLVMDYAPQGSLLTLFPRGTRLALEQVVEYTRQIANALHYAHSQHIIHRDIKQENLLLNEQQQIMISDFGLALLAPAAGELISTQGMEGTLHYMAPEQLRGKPGYATDQYALAIMAYEWLCGSQPFTGTLPEIIYQHSSVPPPALREKNPAIAEAVEAVILKALEKEPAARYPDIQAFAEALAQASQASVPEKQAEPRAVQVSGETGPMLLRLPALEEPRKVITAAIPAIKLPPFLPGRKGLDTPALQPAHVGEHTQEEINAGRGRASSARERMAAPKASLPGRNRNRQRMLDRVRAFWISGIFEQALHERALITPRLVAYPDAVAHPWASVLRPAQPLFSPFAAGTCISEVYDQVDGELLILGAPGSGKTMLALELVRDLLERAEQDESQPIPVVFNLSSWSQEHLPLVEWLVAELNNKYQVPRRLAQRWMDSNALLPVLDGLDEVGEEQCSPCIRAINAYREENGLRPLVVCSRREEYLAQEERVLLRSAIVVQPLTMQQVDAYLEQAAGNFEVLRKALRADQSLRELATTPLLLSTIVSAYRDRPLGELLTRASTQARQQQIFAAYVEQALTRRQPNATYAPPQTVGWLSGLARQMVQQNQSVFYLEHMQPAWLKERLWSRIYEWLAVRLPGFVIGLLCGIIVNNLLFHQTDSGLFRLQTLVGGLIGFLLSDRALRIEHEERGGERRSGWKQLLMPGPLVNGLLMGLVSWLMLLSAYHQYWQGGLIFGGSTLFLSLVLALPLQRKARTRAKPYSLHSMLKHLGNSLDGRLDRTFQRWSGKPGGAIARRGSRAWHTHISNGVLVGFIYAISDRLVEGTQQGLLVGLSYILRDGMRYGLLGALLSVLLLGDQGSIRPSEIIAWSWRRFWRFLRRGEHIINSLLVLLYIGLAYGISYGLSNGLPDASFSKGLSNGLAFGVGYAFSIALCYWLILGLFQGLASESIDQQQRIRPNEGIRRSIRNMFIIAILGMCIGVPIYIASNTLYMGLKEGIRDPLNTWFSSSAPAATSPGGIILAPQGTPVVKQPPKKQTAQATQGKTVAPPAFIKGVLEGWQVGLMYWWIAGIVTALLVALLSGGLASLRHGLLRLLLWRTRALPLATPHFLDYASERILLRKVGGGYIFLHPLLLTYFASLPSQPPRRGRPKRLAAAESKEGNASYAVEGETKLVRLL